MPTLESRDVTDEASEDFPIAIANTPASAEQRRSATVVIVGLIVITALLAPFAHMQLRRVDAFVPALQTVLTVADLMTAVLLFAQYLIFPQRALLAVGCAYVCSASFSFLQTLTFPGAYAPAGLLGDGFNSPAWVFVLWHVTFPLGIFAYVLLKDKPVPLVRSSKSAQRAIGLAIVATTTGIAGLGWLATAGVGNLPAFYTDDVIQQTRLGNQVNVGLMFCYGSVFAVLLRRGRTILDIWLLVILAAWIPNFMVAALASSVRFSLGWYAARGFALVASFVLLSVLLTEMTVLYSRLANAFALLRRERANRSMSLDAATASIAHEIRTPVAAIALNAGTALAMLRSRPPVLDDVDSIVADIEADSFRISQVIAAVRGLFKTTNNRTTVDIEEIVRHALALAEAELRAAGVLAATQFADGIVYAEVDPAQLQQVILNLIRNAIDAMRSRGGEIRRLTLTTRIVGEQSSVIISVQDTGSGISAGDRERIFDAFFTTKASGMGLGLAISRTIVESHQGSLRMAETGPSGSTFEIILPIDVSSGAGRVSVGGYAG